MTTVAGRPAAPNRAHPAAASQRPPESILGLFTEILTMGGLQRVGRHAAVVLSEIAGERGAGLRLLSLNDPLGRHEVRLGARTAEVEGFARRRASFLAAALREAPRVSHAYLAHPALAPLGLPLRLLRPGVRYWVHLHGVEAWRRLPPVARAGLRVATGVIAISRYTADRAAEVQGIARAKLSLLPNALDPALGCMGESAPAPDAAHSRARVVLTVARLAGNERYKGVDTVIAALPLVRESIPDVAYVVVGDGDDRPRLERLAASIGVADRVRFTGRLPESELAAWYRDADVFAMPSSGEGFGVAYLEAMVCGKPVIAGAHGGAPEVVIDGVTGYLVPHDDVRGLAQHLVGLLCDYGLRRRLGEAGRRRVESNFTFDHFRRGLTEIMLLDQPAAR